MTSRERFLRFGGVGLAGMAVQLGALWGLTEAAAVPYQAATLAAVLAAIAHNFAWHRRWTWRDRRVSTPVGGAFARFLAANGVVSIVGNLIVMVVLVETLGVPPLPANVVAIALSAAANFWLADRLVFRPRVGGRARPALLS